MALNAGPKKKITESPYQDNDAIVWAEKVIKCDLYDWQREALLKYTRFPRCREAYIQVPRKSGKTLLAAVLALWEMCNMDGRHIYAVSDSKESLRSVLFREMKQIVGASDLLRDYIHIYNGGLEVPGTNSFLELRPSKFEASQGINPHLVLFDEVHLQKTSDIWYGMQIAGAARDDALLLGITTPGYNLDSLAHELYVSVKKGEMDGMIYESDPALPIEDENTWRMCNPCSDRPGFIDIMRQDFTRLPEHEFRRFRLGQWTATESAWFPYGKWAGLGDITFQVPYEQRIWLGFDGSYSGDSTALVGVTDELHIFVIGSWEKSKKGWRVPRDEVLQTVDETFANYDVQEMLCDPPYWQKEIAEWSIKYPGKVLEFPTHVRARMAQACTTFYSAAMEDKLSHDGNLDLQRHINNCVVKTSPMGDYITKETKDSPAKIDLAVAAVVAFSRATLSFKKKNEPVFLV